MENCTRIVHKSKKPLSMHIVSLCTLYTSTYRVDRLHSRIDYNFIRWQYSCTIKYYIFFIDKKMQFWFSRFPDHKWREWQTVVFWSTARNWVSNIWVSNHKSQKPYNTGPLWSLFLFGGVFSFIVLSGEKQRLRSFLQCIYVHKTKTKLIEIYPFLDYM